VPGPGGRVCGGDLALDAGQQDRFVAVLEDQPESRRIERRLLLEPAQLEEVFHLPREERQATSGPRSELSRPCVDDPDDSDTLTPRR
jgi:hypothetical protein